MYKLPGEEQIQKIKFNKQKYIIIKLINYLIYLNINIFFINYLFFIIVSTIIIIIR